MQKVYTPLHVATGAVKTTSIPPVNREQHTTSRIDQIYKKRKRNYIPCRRRWMEEENEERQMEEGIEVALLYLLSLQDWITKKHTGEKTKKENFMP